MEDEMGHAKRLERARQLKEKLIAKGWTAADAARVAAMQYDVSEHLTK
jgi:hypothetical protein